MQLFYVIGFFLKTIFVIIPTAAWKAFVVLERDLKWIGKNAKKREEKIPPQITIEDPAVREAEKIVDAHLRRKWKQEK